MTSSFNYNRTSAESIEEMKNFQSRIKNSRNKITAYDPKNLDLDNQKIDSFLKMNPANITYAEYIKALRDLPLRVKAVII